MRVTQILISSVSVPSRGHTYAYELFNHYRRLRVTRTSLKNDDK